MMRRSLLFLAMLGVIGCSGRRAAVKMNQPEAGEHPVSAPPPVDLKIVKRRMRDAIEDAQPNLATEFASVAIGLLVEFLVGLISQCLLKHVISQHRAISKNPEGAFARRWKQSIGRQFLEQNPNADQETVDHYVESAAVAFRRSTEIELTAIVQGIQNAQVELSDADWERANRTARGLVRCQEEQ